MATLILDIETVGFDSDNTDSLSPYKGQIVSLGVYDVERDLGSVYFLSGTPEDSFTDNSYSYKARTEKQILEDFWETARNYDIFVTFNGRAFDIPFLYMRSISLGVKPTVEIARQRYVTKQTLPYHVDLFDEFSFHGNVARKPSLAVLCESFGIDNPKRLMSGEDITEYFLAKKMTDIARYNAQDVTAIKALFAKWKEYLAPHSFINSIESL